MAAKATVIASGSNADSRRLSGLLAVFFLLASLIAISEVVKTPRAFSNASDAPGSVQAIRRFYANLNAFMETGDASAVSENLAPRALAFVPETGAMGDESGLLTYLLALRSTVPELRFVVDQIDVSGDIAIAGVRRSAAVDSSNTAWPGEISQEIFRVQDGRIVQHWATGPASMLLHPLASLPIRAEIAEFHHLAIADLTFSRGQHASAPIAGPALVIVLRGRLSLVGDGSAQILDLATGATSVPGPDALVSVRPGQAIAVLERQAYIWNGESEVAGARLATVVEDLRHRSQFIPGDVRPPTATINDYLLVGSRHTMTYGHVTVRPLEFDNRSVSTGDWTLEVAWVVLGPGRSHPLAEEGEWSLAHVISGSAIRGAEGQHEPETPNVLINNGDMPVVALAIRATRN